MFLEISQNSQENTCARAFFFNKVTEVSKNTFSYRTPPVAASVITMGMCIKNTAKKYDALVNNFFVFELVNF